MIESFICECSKPKWNFVVGKNYCVFAVSCLVSKQTLTCSNSTMETLATGAKYVQS